MKKIIALICAIVAVIIIVVAIIFINDHHNEVVKENQIKLQQEQLAQEKAQKEEAAKTLAKKESEEPNYLSKAVQEIDKTNYDTYYWWNVSEGQLLAQLSKEAKEYNDKQIQSIVDNANIIPSYLIRLAVMHPESIAYVAGYPTRKLNQPINIDAYYQKGQYPLFEQFDKQWGYDFYGTGPLATDGCGPTALAMAIVGLTGNTNVNPDVVANYSVTHGGYIDNEGSTGALMTSVAEHFGIIGTPISAEGVITSLENGHPVIVDEGPGLFTLTGHYMLLTGINKDGQITINDPDSIKYSKETWSLNQIAESAKAFWSYSLA
ncbi:MAG: C39 family peptidase [Sarcina sp.]